MLSNNNITSSHLPTTNNSTRRVNRIITRHSISSIIIRITVLLRHRRDIHMQRSSPYSNSNRLQRHQQ